MAKMARARSPVWLAMIIASSIGASPVLTAAQTQTCAVDSSTGTCKPINKTCDALEDHQIDWDCIFGPESLEEVFQRGGKFTTCPSGSKMKPCSRFIVAKDEERSEVKVQEGPEGFPFLKNEKYTFKYSFRAVEDMKVATRFTHLGQLKGSAGGYMIKGDPIYSLTANKYGLMVRFSNLESIEDFHPGMEEFLDWEDATGEWVHVEIVTTFGQSMEVNISGAVNGKAVWPSNLKPVAWHRDSEMVRMKLGLYHSIHNVADGEVEYRDISIEGPMGIIRTSPLAVVETCTINPATGECEKINITCDVMKGNTIDWECLFGPGALTEVEARGGKMLTCLTGTKSEPCSRFVVPKEKERAEVIVENPPTGFDFRKGETYTFKYSFRAKEGMRVSGSSTRFGQLKGSSGGFLLKGDPLMAITATNDGLNVRFANLDSNRRNGMDRFLSWEAATGEWVHVVITTTFGRSMKVDFSGAVEGTAVWPSSYRPVAWSDDADMMRFRLGLYHIKDKVGDGEVEYKNVSIEGPNGVIRSSSMGVNNEGSPEGIMFVGCVRDRGDDRVLSNMYRTYDLTPDLCAEYCAGEEFFGTQNANECWCGSGDGKDVFRHGTAFCDYPCSGDDELTCGAAWAMSLYEYGSPPVEEIPDGTKYLGCYRDARFERALSLKLTTSTDMTHEWCNNFCAQFDAKYFGLQYGRECFCGAADENYARYGTATCDVPCAGDPGLICGGSLALNIFMRY